YRWPPFARRFSTPARRAPRRAMMAAGGAVGARRRRWSSPRPGAAARGAACPQVRVHRTRDGSEVRGVRRNEDTFSVQMVDASGTLHLFDKLQLASFRIENRSLMPGVFGTKLTANEIDDLVAYLATLRERDLTAAATASISG